MNINPINLRMKQSFIHSGLGCKLLVLCCLFAGTSMFAQSSKELTLKAPISEVTVYLKGAQVTRNLTTSVNEGKSTLKITNLSPYIDSKSVQVRINNNNITVLSVNHQLNFLDSLKKSKEADALLQQLEMTKDKLQAENIRLEVIKFCRTSGESRWMQPRSRDDGDGGGCGAENPIQRDHGTPL